MAVLGRSAAGLRAYLLGNRGGGDATFLPERVISEFYPTMQYFNP